jgi:exodeoxyribonuclease V alpha subunit
MIEQVVAVNETKAFVDGETVLLEGAISAITMRNERDGYTVADFALADGRMTKIVGSLAAAPIGEPVTIAGVFEHDPDFGLQFRIFSTIETMMSAELAAGYLASGLVPHVGPAGAALISEAFGSDTLRILVAEPERLMGFRGITAKRMPEIKRALRETLHLAPVVGLLDQFGISLRLCRRVYHRYGAGAGETIRANPWRLANEIAGIGFTTADRVATGLGRALDSPERIEAGVLQALRDFASDAGNITNGGSIVIAESVLAARAGKLTGQPYEAVAAAARHLVKTGEIEAIESPSGFALPRLVAAERLIAAKVRSIISFADLETPRVSEAEIAGIEASEGITFDESQRRAIKGVLEERITVITGEPGTGKTTIVRAVLDLAESRGLKAALVSPTGRAAKRLSEATHRPAQTIHRWLHYHPDTGYAGPTELPDLLVCDEVSMLDSLLAARLFEALPPFARILLVGDENQLPAIGPGNVLSDLMGASFVHVLRLTTIHRTARGSGVPALAHQIRSGVREPVFDRLSTRLVVRETTEEIAEWIKSTIATYADRAEEFQVLCPMLKGPAGTHALNKAMQEILNPPVPGAPTIRRAGFDLRVGDRVIQTTNDYESELFNGEIGYLREVHEDGSIVLDLDGDIRRLPSGGGDGLTLAYAMTVHKAQGSEFPIVIVPLHYSYYIMLKRRLLYTAVSRARQTVVIVGQVKAMATAIRDYDPMARRTLLGALLGSGNAPETPLVPLGLPEEDLF